MNVVSSWRVDVLQAPADLRAELLGEREGRDRERIADVQDARRLHDVACTLVADPGLVEHVRSVVLKLRC